MRCVMLISNPWDFAYKSRYVYNTKNAEVQLLSYKINPDAVCLYRIIIVGVRTKWTHCGIEIIL